MEGEAIASRLEAIASRLEAMASRLEAMAIRFPSRVEGQLGFSFLQVRRVVGWRCRSVLHLNIQLCPMQHHMFVAKEMNDHERP